MATARQTSSVGIRFIDDLSALLGGDVSGLVRLCREPRLWHDQRYAAAWMPYSSAYCPPFAMRASWVPTSTTREPSSTTIRSAIRTVLNRCDTRIVMRPSDVRFPFG